MAQWECVVCGLIYDEEEGWPDDGIAPGTKWENVPHDWTCPDCGVSKEDFELIPGTDIETNSNPHNEGQPSLPILILGSGLAGYGLVKELRKFGNEQPLTIVTADGGEVYSKPMLSNGYTKGLTPKILATGTAAATAGQHNIKIITRCRATGIDTTGNFVTLESGEILSYSALVLALGADLITPPILGNAADSIMGVNDLDDYANFQASLAAQNAKHIAVIGAGLIGSEFTNDLINGGYQVTAIDPLETCLPMLIPPTAGRAVQKALEDRGACFRFGVFATEVNRHNQSYRVALSDNTSVNADAVLCAVGVKPRIKLALEAGIAVGHGIKTDRQLRTNISNIFALGDCAEVAGHVLVYVAPLMAASRALAKTLSGEATNVCYPAMPINIKTPACPVTVCPPPTDATGSWEITGKAPNIRAVFNAPSGKLLGFALTGQAIREKTTLTRQLPAVLS